MSLNKQALLYAGLISTVFSLTHVTSAAAQDSDVVSQSTPGKEIVVSASRVPMSANRLGHLKATVSPVRSVIVKRTTHFI